MTRSRPTKRPNCRHSQSQDSHTSQPTAVVVLPDVWGGIGAAPGNQGDTLELNPSTPELKQVPAWSETATVCEEKYSAQLSWSTCHLVKLNVKTILKLSNLWCQTYVQGLINQTYISTTRVRQLTYPLKTENLAHLEANISPWREDRMSNYKQKPATL